MASDKGVPLPKFGEWDVNNPASAEGFTVIFTKARDDKKSNVSHNNSASQKKQYDNNNSPKKPEDINYEYPSVKKWFCCF